MHCIHIYMYIDPWPDGVIYARIFYVYVVWVKVTVLYTHQPLDQLAYFYNFAHWDRDDMMGCPQRLDDVVYAYTYAWYDIYTHIHDTMKISRLLSYSDLQIESFTPCFFHVFYILLFMPYILSTCHAPNSGSATGAQPSEPGRASLLDFLLPKPIHE